MTAHAIPQTARCPLPAGLQASRVARQLVRAWLAEAGPGLTVVEDELVLLASELAANAAEHGQPPAFLALSAELRNGATVVIATVHDAGEDLPRLRGDADPDDERHRGMVLIASLASQWGIRESADGGKDVWCELRRRQRERADVPRSG